MVWTPESSAQMALPDPACRACVTCPQDPPLGGDLTASVRSLGQKSGLMQLSAGHVDRGWPAGWNTHELACEARAGEEGKQDRGGGTGVLVPTPPHPNTELQAVQEFCI